MNRPKVTLSCPADKHHAEGERIVEFSFPNGANGLISFRTANGPASDPIPILEIYGLDNTRKEDAAVVVRHKCTGDLKRADPPADPQDRSDRDDPIQFRVWKRETVWDTDPTPWKCMGAFYYLTCALDYIASCQDAGLDVIFQSPAEVREVKHTDRRVVYRPEPQLQGA